MNWLAHLHLSEPTPAFRLGNLLPDLLSARELSLMPSEFQPGIQRHWQIDAFTDAHPLCRRSAERLEPPFRRFGGVLIDVFYDHILASRWPAYSPTPLPQFAAEIYTGFEPYWHLLPEETRSRLQRMRDHNWLCAYREISGIATTLDRIGKRLRQPVDLAPAASLLERHYDLFSADFSAFYPELQADVLKSI